MSARIDRLEPEHAGEALTVQLAAYVTEARRYREPEIPPLTETVDELRRDLRSPEILAFGAWLGHRLVGAVRGRPDGTRMEISRFVVAPDVQGRGIGSTLLAAVEAKAPAGVSVLWLVTGARSTENLRLYRRAGYRVVDQRVDSAGVGLVMLEKSR